MKKTTENPFLRARQKRLQQILQLCKKVCPLGYLTLVGMIEVNYGLKRETAQEHISALIRAGYIIREKGTIKVI